MPEYNAKLEALLPVIRKELPLKAHVHRADDIFTAIRIAKEFDLNLKLDHVTDGSLIADELAKEGYSLAVGPSFGYATKYELKIRAFPHRQIWRMQGAPFVLSRILLSVRSNIFRFAPEKQSQADWMNLLHYRLSRSMRQSISKSRTGWEALRKERMRTLYW